MDIANYYSYYLYSHTDIFNFISTLVNYYKFINSFAKAKKISLFSNS